MSAAPSPVLSQLPTQRLPDERPLVVDLGGILRHSDLSFENANLQLGTLVGRLSGWLEPRITGRPVDTAGMASAARLDVTALPYREDVVAWLRLERQRGRTLVLSVDSPFPLAEMIATHLGLFSSVIELDGGAITRDELVRRFGERGFDYLGDDRRASPVWATAHTAHVVTTSNHLPQESRNSLAIGQVFSRTDTPVVALIAALRPHQWLKNLLVFVPLVTSHLLLDGTKLFAAVVALVSFSLCASSAYVLNDLVDVQDDRRHRTKRMRAFASGRLSLRLGWIAWPLLLVVGVAISLPILPSHFVVALAAYYVIAVAYSLYLKRKMMMDVVALAVLYTVRIVAGAAAINVALSFWLLTFAMFVFTSLALVKRYAELRIATGGNTAVLPGRQLSPRDLDMVSMLGVAAGYISVMVLALYIQDPETRTLYSHPVRIWPACPILLYWFSRTWMFAHRGWMNEDPVLFAARDRVSFIVVGLIACAFFLAR